MLRITLFLVFLVGCYHQGSFPSSLETVRPGAPIQVFTSPREVIAAPSPEEFQPRGPVWDFSTPVSPPSNSVYEESVRRAVESSELRRLEHRARAICYHTQPCRQAVVCYYSRGGFLMCQ